VPRRRSLRRSRKIQSGALSIGAFERGRWRLGQTPAIIGIRIDIPLEVVKSLTTGLFYEHSKYGASLKRLPLLTRERNRSERKPRPTSTRSVCRASGFVQTPFPPPICLGDGPSAGDFLPTLLASMIALTNGIGTKLRFDLTRSGLGRTAAFRDFAFAPELKPNGTGYRAYTYVHMRI
jgi:hypothetical protein